MNKRDTIRQALGVKPLTCNQVVLRTGLSRKEVATILSAMRNHTKEVTYVKIPGETSGKYRLINPVMTITVVKDIELKLSQLREVAELMRSKGVSMIDDIIDDYEKMKLTS